jgi:aconitate hydratase
MFRRFDTEFPARAQDWGGGIVVAGHNYGQGSSREQAAFAALYLGVRAVVAKSFARIHRTNLIAQGIAPLAFGEETDYDLAGLGDDWRIRGLGEAVRSGSGYLSAETPKGPVRVEAYFTRRERTILLAGGLIAHARAGA